MSARLRILIADDEATARRRLIRLLGGIQGTDLVHICETGESALAMLRESEVDVAILDIRMPGLSGVDVAKLAATTGVSVVFQTAHAEHAVEAFELDAVDYVLKPVDAARLAASLEKVRARRALAPMPMPMPMSTSASAPTPGADARIAIASRGEVRLVDPREISHATLAHGLVTVHVGDEAILADASLSDLERDAPAGTFERVHRTALLALAHVIRLRPLDSGGYVAITRDGAEVPVGRKAARALRKRLGIR